MTPIKVFAYRCVICGRIYEHKESAAIARRWAKECEKKAVPIPKIAVGEIMANDDLAIKIVSRHYVCGNTLTSHEVHYLIGYYARYNFSTRQWERFISAETSKAYVMSEKRILSEFPIVLNPKSDIKDLG